MYHPAPVNIEEPAADVKDKKEKEKAGAPGDSADKVFQQGPSIGIPPNNTTPAISVLRVLAVDYHVTAEQVDLLVELFDDNNHKVRIPLVVPLQQHRKCLYMSSALLIFEC
jgi:hypothetical protein